MTVLDRIRGRNRIEDPKEAMRAAEIEEEARRRLETAEKEAMVESEFLRQAKQRGLKVGRQPPSSDTSGPPATGQGAMPMNVNVQAELKPKERDWGTIVMIVVAYIIWVVDLSPGNIFGKPYSGFIFDTSILLNVNWIGVATSAVVSLFLLYDIAMSIGEKGEKATINYLIEMGVIAFINSASLAAYYWKAFSNPAVNFAFLAIAVLSVGYILYKKGFSAIHGLDLIAYWVMVLTYSFFWTLWNWTSNYKAIIHMGFITFFMLFYLKKKENININRLYLGTSVFLLIDFFGYSYDFIIPFTKLSFPIMVLATALYSMRFTQSTFGLVNGIVWTIIFVAAWAFPSAPYAAEIGVDIAERQSGGFAGFTDSLSKAWEAFNLKITGRLDVATGGLYSAQVEKNQFEPLGVFLDKVRASQPRFYPDEPMTIWSSIKSRTLSDPVTIRFNCYRYGKDNKRIGIKKKDPLTGEEKIDPEEGGERSIIPEKPFTVFTLEEKDIECTFKEKKFQPGTNSVTISAEYNFVTSAYQEVRFIDRNRHQAMIKENLDPLKEFGITNKNPETIYTNGPVEIKMTVQNPVTVDLTSPVLPNLGITLKNRDKITDKQGKTVGQWQGKILNIEELAIIVPKGVKIHAGNCQPARFISYTKPMCIESCKKTCRDTCEEGSEKAKCLNDCNTGSTINRKCDDECTILFKDEEGFTDYEGYQLDTQFIKSSIPPEKRKSIYEDIGRFTQFGCRLDLNQDVLEEGVSVTRKYIRVRAKYNYLLESTYSVSVEAIPTLDTTKEIEGAIQSGLQISPETLKFDDGAPIPPHILLGLVSLESQGIHCCQEKTIGFKGCKPDTTKLHCPDTILTSSWGSVGIMQIDNRPKAQADNAKRLQKLKDKGLCKPNEDIFDRDCNIWMGLEILKEKYAFAKSGHPNKDDLKKICPSDQTFSSETFGYVNKNLYQMYSGYTGIDAALRGYNGWSCKVDEVFKPRCSRDCGGDAKCVNRCIEHTVFYVDILKKRAQDIQNKKLPSPVLFEFDLQKGEEEAP